MNILDIKYCAQDLRFEESAFKKFDQYEQELKKYFLEQADGYDIFEDLKLRICEMLQSKMKISGEPISEQDVADIKNSIGHVEQLERMVDETEETVYASEPMAEEGSKKKLYRNQNETMIAGVCSGLGNYFSIDPLAFRLLFVVVTLMSKGFGIVAYAIFWIALQPKALPANLSKRLYRNGADKVIAGVCGGLASFFKTEAWIIRVLFLSPLILNITSSGLFNFGFSFFNGSALGFSIITYIILWLTTKESETPTEELLARGEEININSISEESEKVHTNPDTNSGLNNILRVIAFVVIGFALVGTLLMLLGLSFLSVFMWPLVDSVLHTSLFKWLGWLSILFFIMLPFAAGIVWSIRRFNGIKGPSKVLRISFGSLWALGFASAIVLAFFIGTNLQNKATTTERIDLVTTSDTLYVNSLATDVPNVKVSFGNSMMQNIYGREGNDQLSKLVTIKRKVSKNNSFYMDIVKSAQGSNDDDALKNAQLADYEYSLEDNQLSLSKVLRVPKNSAFRIQRVDVILYVPENKVLISDGTILDNSKKKRKKKTLHIEEDWDDLDDETQEEIKESLEEAIDEVGEAMEEVGDAMEEVGQSIEKAGKNLGNVDEKIEKAEAKSKAKVRIEEQKLRLEKERLKLEEMQKAINESESNSQ